MTTATTQHVISKPVKHWYPAANPNREPSAWWYWGRAIYVSRRDYWKITRVFLTAGVPLGTAGVLFKSKVLFDCALSLAAIGLVLLAYSLFGLYRMYGHPARRYFTKLLSLSDIQATCEVADLHIGTYRHSYALAGLLPAARIASVDCWDENGPAAEPAVQDVRDLEPPPQHHPRIHPLHARNFELPLSDASVGLVVFGFGTHEVPTGGAREKLFAEAHRILKPGGRVLLFEHGWDPHNYLIFGPVIYHVTPRRAWKEFLEERFDSVRYARSTAAVDLFAGVRHA